MRVSAAGYLGKTEDEVIKLATDVTRVTHNHKEGIKGAITTAMMIFKARNGASFNKLYDYAISMYPKISSLDYENLRNNYKFNETCQDSVPQAIYCFLINDSFEDCLRTTISIGGDSDTLAAISCAIAEAYYKEIPNELARAVRKKLPNEILCLLDKIVVE